MSDKIGYSLEFNMKKKTPTTIPAIHPNLGIKRWYKRELMKIIDEMRSEVNTAIMENYKYQAATVAMDGVSDWLGHVIDYLTDKWNTRLNSLSETIAELFVSKSVHNYDAQFKRHLRKAGFTVRLQLTPFAEEALKASIGENVGLIKSIGVQYLGKVEQAVWASVKGGFDLKTLADELQHAHHITRNRAELIARDQAAKANAVIEMARRKELGITKAVWIHSGGGKEPRKSHVKANGTIYEIDKGCYIDGEYILPAQKINCFDGKLVLSNASGVKKLWRRRYTGKLSKLVMSSGESINATPNHPILTNRGWIPISSINKGDYVVKTLNKGFNTTRDNINSGISTFSKVFDATSLYIGSHIASGTMFEFHGDISDSEVDTINIAGFLPSEINRSALKKVFELFFSNANHVFISSGFKINSSLSSTLNTLFCAPESVVSGACSVLSLLKGHLSCTNDISLRLSSYMNSAINEAASYCDPADIELLGKCQFAHSRFVQGDDFVIGELFEGLCLGLWDSETPSADFLGDNLFMHTESISSFNKGDSLIKYEIDCVIDNRLFDFSDHVYNLENIKNWYSVENIVSHNCRCVSRAIIDGVAE